MVAEQNKHTEPIKNHFTIFTLLAFPLVLKEIYGENATFTIPAGFYRRKNQASRVRTTLTRMQVVTGK